MGILHTRKDGVNHNTGHECHLWKLKQNKPHILIGASSSSRMGWLIKTSRLFVHRKRISCSASCTCLPGLLPRTGTIKLINTNPLGAVRWWNLRLLQRLPLNRVNLNAGPENRKKVQRPRLQYLAADIHQTWDLHQSVSTNAVACRMAHLRAQVDLECLVITPVAMTRKKVEEWLHGHVLNRVKGRRR